MTKVLNPESQRNIEVDKAIFKQLISKGYIYDSISNTLTLSTQVDRSLQSENSSSDASEITPPVKLKKIVIKKVQQPTVDFKPLGTQDLVAQRLNIPDSFNPEYIVHLSDIHIPINLHVKRHSEYTEVFNNLYTELYKLPLDKTLIIITGDLVNTKLRTENETLVMAQNFLSKLASLTHIIVIIGNHDFAENNPDRVDSISAICNTLPNVHVLKTTGIYTIYTITFVFNSLFDLKFIKRSDVPQTNTPVYALYHGSLIGAQMDNGSIINSPRNKRYPLLKDFSGFDAVLLGHIHKYQQLQSNIAYAGSLIQQHYGETIEHHGFLLWDIKSHTAKHFEIYNPYVFIKIIITNGEICEVDEKMLDLLKPRHLRIRCDSLFNTTPSQFQTLENSLRSIYDVEELICKPQDIVVTTTNPEIPNVITLDIELNIISKEMHDRPELCKNVSDLHKELHQAQPDTIKYNVWYPITMEFTNLSYYGNNYMNKINFITGIIDICSPNMTGKTSIVNILLFMLYGKMLDGKSDILNKTTKSGHAELIFMCNGQKYSINKNISTKKRSEREADNAPIYNTTFHKLNSDGTRTCINGTTEIDTIKIIQEYVCTFDQFVNNNIISSKIPSSVLSMKPADQTRHFHTICNLSHYDTYLNKSKEKHKDIKEKLRKLNCANEINHTRLSMLNKSTLITHKTSTENTITTTTKTLESFRIEYSTLISDKSKVHCNIETIQEQLSGFNDKLTKKDLNDIIADSTTKLNDYGQITVDDALKYTEAGLIEQINDARKKYTHTSENIISINDNITETEQQIILKLSTKPTDKIDSVYHKEGERGQELKEKTLLLHYHDNRVKQSVSAVKCNISEHNSIIQQQDEIKQRLNKLDSHTYTINDIPKLQKKILKITDTKDITETKIKTTEATLAISKSKKDAYSPGTYKSPGKNTLNQLLKSKQTPIQIEAKKTLPVGQMEQMEQMEQEIKTFPTKMLPPLESHIIIFSKRKYVLYDTAVEYNKSVYYQTKQTEYNNLLLDIEYNNNIDTLVQQNNDILKHNDIIDKQIRGLELHELELTIKTQQDLLSELDTYRNNFELVNVLTTLKEIKQLKEQMILLDNKLSYIEYTKQQELIKKITSDIDNLNKQLLELHTYKNWYDTHDVLTLKLKDLIQHRVKYYENQKHNDDINKYSKYHKILQLNNKKLHAQDHLCSWDQYTELSMLTEKLTTMQKNIHIVDNHIKNTEKTLTEATQKHVEITRNIQDIDELEANSIRYASETSILETKCKIYTEYEKLFHRNGIPAKLLERKLEFFAKTVNTIFQKYTKYTFECILNKNDEKQKQTIDITIRNPIDDTVLGYNSLSGFESILLRIAVNIAILDMDTTFKASIFIIDESLDCIDKDRFETCLPTIFSVLRSHYNSTIVISHRDVPKDIVDGKINIEHHGSYSTIE